MRQGAKIAISCGLVCALILVALPQFLRSQAAAKGQLVGFVFNKDGSTPIAGAVVVARNVTTGSILESQKTDNLGAFRFTAMDAGIYALGVTSGQGNYNSRDFVGIKPDETAKVSIALDPYDADSIEAARAVAKEEKERGESRVGKVVIYSPQTREAIISIERGLIQTGDQVRIKGQVTDFSQEINRLRVQGAAAKRAMTGQEAMIPMSRACAAGDSVYVVCKRGVPPLFLAPLGIAAIVAGSASLLTIEEEEQVTPSKPATVKN